MLRNRTFAMATGLAIGFLTLATTVRGQVPSASPSGFIPGPEGMPGQSPIEIAGMMGQGGASENPAMLLLAPSVQNELKLTDEQKTKLLGVAKGASQKGRELVRSMALAGNNANVNPRAMMASGMNLRQETDKAIAKVLDPKQKERLNQIALRAEGPLAIARPEVAAKLRLTNNQGQFVQGIMNQMRNELFLTMQQAASAGQLDPNQFRTVSARLREGAVQEISKVIDRKQKDAFNKMLGEPFDVSKLDDETGPAAAAVNSARPVDTPRAKDAPATEKEKENEATKEPQGNSRKKGRSRSSSNP